MWTSFCPINELMDAVETTSHGSDERLAALQKLAAHPCSWHRVLATEVWAEISDLHRQRRDWDQAIAAWEQTIQLGYRSTPHPRAQIAELLVLAGRRHEGDALYGQLLDRFPRNVWLRNSAALTYLDIADWPTALWWIDTGLDLIMNDGDQVGLIDQLVDMRSRALAALGRSGDDDIGRRVAAFVPSPRSWSAGAGESWGEVEPSTERCEHCDGQPDHVGWIPTDVNDDLWAVQSLAGSNFPAVEAEGLVRGEAFGVHLAEHGSGVKVVVDFYVVLVSVVRRIRPMDCTTPLSAGDRHDPPQAMSSGDVRTCGRDGPPMTTIARGVGCNLGCSARAQRIVSAGTDLDRSERAASSASFVDRTLG